MPKAIVAPLRGGWIGHIVAQELGIPFYPMYSSTRNDDKTVKPKNEQYFGYPSIPPEIDDIIMVDDMVDEGVTGKEIAEYFCTRPQIKKFRSAVLFQKERERSYTADIVLHEIDDVWVCQPFETQYEDPEENQKVITACEEILRDLHRDTTEKLRAQELIDMFRMDRLADTVSKRTK